MADQDDVRIRELREQIAARLHHVCAHWPIETFEEMVRGLAAITLRYEHEGQPPRYDPEIAEQVIADLKAVTARSEARRSGQQHRQPPDDPT